ncbi:MAG TPA: 50S ribosomal protein L11 methyltransferase [Syntrophobacteraceae bacterium]|nr:50S ribosomal protein L11 methyltransferase [Syntrophobacteraceae bacterium]
MNSKKSSRCEDESALSPTSGAGCPICVYELTGTGRPRDVPCDGLEGVWPEPPFYYLFYRKRDWEPGLPLGGPSSPAPASLPGFSGIGLGAAREADDPVVLWLKSHPDWRLTARYDLPYEKWQDVSVSQISLGSFDIRLAPAPADNPAGISIVIDPGVVFGSGLHPATQGCLLAISEIFRTNSIHTAVDFGTGTGVLAIACALAGAKFVPAIDRNPIALRVARRNLRANGVEGRVALVEADVPECLGMQPDLFIMNLEWPILKKILAAGEWRGARRVVLAGFLESRADEVKRSVQPEFRVDNVIQREGWPTITAVNSHPPQPPLLR